MFALIRETIEAEHGRLTQGQLNQLHQLVEQTDFTRLRGDPAQVMRRVTRRYVESLWPVGQREGFTSSLDELSLTNATMAEVTINKVDSQIVSQKQQKKAYICLDSFNRRVDNDKQSSVYSWYYTEQRTTTAGFITSTAPIKNITSIRLYQPSVPAWPQLNSSGRVSIYFPEFSTYAYSPANSQPYHYLLRYSTSIMSARFVELNLEEYNNGVFTFQKPITKLDTLSVSFGNPNNTITFNNDRDTGHVTGYGNSTTITMDNPHNLQNNDVVYIKEFVTGLPGYDAGLNNGLGFAVSVTGANTFTVAVNTSSGSIPWIPNAAISCLYGPFRLIMPLEIRYIDELY